MTGFGSAEERNKYAKGKKTSATSPHSGMEVYKPQPTKFEGYFNFPRPLSKPYVNKTQFFKMSVLKKPKPLVKNKFLNKKNNLLQRRDQNYRSNNVGTSFLTGKRVRQTKSQQNKREVIRDLKNSKLMKSVANNEDPAALRGKKGVIDKVLSLQKAITNNDETLVHGRVLQKPLNKTIAGFHPGMTKN